MNVLFVVLEDFPGGDTRVRRQASSLLKRGHTVSVICARAYSEGENWNGCHVMRTWTRRKKNGSMSRRLFEYLTFFIETTVRVLLLGLFQRIHVVQVANMPDFLVFATSPLRFVRKCAVVLDLHDLMPELLASKSSTSSLWTRSVLWQERVSILRADTILTVNNICLEILQKRHPEAIISMIPNSPDPATFPIYPPRIFRQNRAIRIGYHGTVAKRFGVACLLQAMRILLDKNITLELDVWGDGSEMSSVGALAKSLHINQSIRFHGQTPVNKLVDMLQFIDISVIPYEADPYMAIAYSTKAFELAALGIPIVISDLPGVREQFSDAAVTYFPAGDAVALARALEAIIAEPERTQKMALIAQQELQRFSWDKFSELYSSKLEILCSP